MSTATRTAVTVTFRIDKNDCEAFAVFNGERATNRPLQDAQAFMPAEGHFPVDRSYYEQQTRPATAAESQPVWDALTARGYDVTRATRMAWA